MHHLPEGLHHQGQSQGTHATNTVTLHPSTSVLEVCARSSSLDHAFTTVSFSTNTKIMLLQLILMLGDSERSLILVYNYNICHIIVAISPITTCELIGLFLRWLCRYTWELICGPTERPDEAGECRWTSHRFQSHPRTQSSFNGDRISFIRTYPRHSLMEYRKRYAILLLSLFINCNIIR